jgi:hypothetical protein
LLSGVAADVYLPELSVAVPVGVAPAPVTVIATGTAALLTIDFDPGVTVTDAVPFVPPPDPPVLLGTEGEDEPQPTPAKRIAAANMQPHSSSRHLRTLPGKHNTSSASAPDVPAAPNHRAFPTTADVAAVVCTDALAIPVVTVALSATGEPVTLHVGGFIAPAGAPVTAQVSATLPT